MDLIYVSSSDDDSNPTTNINFKPRRPITRSTANLALGPGCRETAETTARAAGPTEEAGHGAGGQGGQPPRRGWRRMRQATSPASAEAGDVLEQTRPPRGGRWRSPSAAEGSPAPQGAGGAAQEVRPPRGGRRWQPTGGPAPHGAGGDGNHARPLQGSRRRQWTASPASHEAGDDDLAIQPLGGVRRRISPERSSTTAEGRRTMEKNPSPGLEGEASMEDAPTVHPDPELDRTLTSTADWDPDYVKTPIRHETPQWSPIIDPNPGIETAATFFAELDPAKETLGRGPGTGCPPPEYSPWSDSWDILGTPYADLTGHANNTPEPTERSVLPTWMEDPSEDWMTSPMPTPTPTEPMGTPLPTNPPTTGLNGQPLSITSIDMRIQFNRGPVFVNGEESDGTVNVRIETDPMTGETRIIRF